VFTAIEKKVAANQPVTVDEVNASTRYLITDAQRTGKGFQAEIVALRLLSV
jgi:hypothetical protein